MNSTNDQSKLINSKKQKKTNELQQTREQTNE